jgi:hypothetical protein
LCKQKFWSSVKWQFWSSEIWPTDPLSLCLLLKWNYHSVNLLYNDESMCVYMSGSLPLDLHKLSPQNLAWAPHFTWAWNQVRGNPKCWPIINSPGQHWVAQACTCIIILTQIPSNKKISKYRWFACTVVIIQLMLSFYLCTKVIT